MTGKRKLEDGDRGNGLEDKRSKCAQSHSFAKASIATLDEETCAALAFLSNDSDDDFSSGYGSLFGSGDEEDSEFADDLSAGVEEDYCFRRSFRF